MSHITERTDAFFERARQVMPFGVSSNFRWWGEGKDIGVARAEGAYIWDFDGNRYIDWTSGVLVANIQPHSPAAAGNALHPGDIITGLGGKLVRSIDDWTGEMLDIRVNNTVELSILRSGRTLTVALSPVEKPSDKLKRYSTGLGFELIELTPEVRSQIEARSTHGAVIVDITDPDLEQEGSILPFDILYRINDIKITSADQALRLLERLSRAQVTVLFPLRDLNTNKIDTAPTT